MESHEELISIARALSGAAEGADTSEFKVPIDAIELMANSVGEAASGSWLGYHSLVYYANFQEPPPGAHFSQEWGFVETFGDYGTRGDWHEYTANLVTDYIETNAGCPDLTIPRDLAKQARSTFHSAKSDFLSIIEGELSEHEDKFLEKLKRDLETLKTYSEREVLKHMAPSGQLMSRDMLALNQGLQAPPHLSAIAEVVTLRQSLGVCKSASDIVLKAAAHINRQSRRRKSSERVGTNVFVGHGRSLLWRELKDFVGDRLGLPWDEFNRVPVAGVTNIARLAEMLDAAAIAFLVMTAEDELVDGPMQARTNVIHEAGLFQGRLGFSKAIILLEEGCSEFSNIQGLGQIRFPKGNIGASFEEIRRVLEREGLIEA